MVDLPQSGLLLTAKVPIVTYDAEDPPDISETWAPFGTSRLRDMFDLVGTIACKSDSRRSASVLEGSKLLINTFQYPDTLVRYCVSTSLTCLAGALELRPHNSGLVATDGRSAGIIRRE